MISTNDSGHIPALDGVRGIAILTVLVFHFVELPQSVQQNLSPFALAVFHTLRVGWLGVDIFFVLSGFLITSTLLRSRSGPRYYVKFYWRRVLRIMPVYYGALTLLALLFWIRPPHSPVMQAAAPHQLWMWLFLSNVAMAISVPIAFPHFWSLAVEEHFYLFWPWVVRKVEGKRFVPLCVWVIATIWTARAIGTTFLRPDALYLLTPFRMDALAAGALVAGLVYSGRVASVASFCRKALPASIALFAVVHFAFDCSRPDGKAQALIGYTLIELAAFSAIVVALTTSNTAPARRFLEIPLLRSYGKFSYSIYAMHVPLHPLLWVMYARSTAPVRALMQQHVIADLMAFTLFGSAACLAAGCASWHLFEKRILRFKGAFDEQSVPAPERFETAGAL